MTAAPLLAPAPTEGEAGGLFDLINGIPVHPLVVHAAVVLVPLAAIGVLVMAFAQKFSARFGWVVVAVAAAGAAFSLVAKEAGEALEARVGEPGFDHAELGDVMPIVAGLLLVAAAALWLLDRRRSRTGSPGRALRATVAAAAVLVAVGNMFWMFRVGESGAKSVWSDEVAAPAAQTGRGPAAED